MKQLLILSGKGGTGKTTMATAFIKLQKAKVYADCDVDAPNLHISVLQDTQPIKSDFIGLPKALINQDQCIGCGICKDYCRFDAIEHIDDTYKINNYACEGCGVCQLMCPQDAVSLIDDVAGDLLIYKSETLFSTAKLRMGSGTSGKLVSEVKKQIKDADEEMVIVDGSPGIGCPVIASLSGADMVLVVTEPTLSGISDMERIVAMAKGFDMKIGICINKWDINLNNTESIKTYCKENGIPFIGHIPYDKSVVTCLNEGRSIIDCQGDTSDAIKQVFINTKKILLMEEKV